MTSEEKVAYIVAAIEARPELTMMLFKKILYQALPAQPEVTLDLFIAAIDGA